MPTLTNPTADAINVPEFGLNLDAGESAFVSDAVAAAFADHPVLVVTDAQAVVEPAPVIVPAPVIEVTEPAPVAQHIPTQVEMAEAEVAKAAADLLAAQAATTDAAPAANTEEGK